MGARVTKIQKRADALGITVDELKQKRADRAEKNKKKHQERGSNNQRPQLSNEYSVLADLYAEEYTTFDALRMAMLKKGIVEHRISPYDVIQRAIDDCATDYLLLRQRLESKHHGNIEDLTDDPLYEVMTRTREAMVRYSTFAMQYDIQLRQVKLSEARIGILGATLRTVLQNMGMPHDQISKVPQLLIEQITAREPAGLRASKIDAQKARAIAEILHNDTEVTIELDDDQAIDIDAEATDVA
jgi:hypothetical protein